MDYRRWASAQTLSGVIGTSLLIHGLYAILTFERSGPPCHFCAIEPGLAGPFLEIGLGVPLAVLGTAVFSTDRFNPTVGLPRTVYGTLLVGSVLTLGATVYVMFTHGYGIIVAGPVMLLGFVVIFIGIVAGIVVSLRPDEPSAAGPD